MWWGWRRLASTLARRCAASWREKPSSGGCWRRCWGDAPMTCLAGVLTHRRGRCKGMPRGWRRCGRPVQPDPPPLPPPLPIPATRSKLPTHHPEDRNTFDARAGAAAAVAAAGAAASAAADAGGGGGGGGAAAAAAEPIDPKAQDLQFLFLAMTEEVRVGGARNRCSCRGGGHCRCGPAAGRGLRSSSFMACVVETAPPAPAWLPVAGTHHRGEAGRPAAQHAYYGVHAARQAAPHRAGDAAGAGC